MIEVPFQLDELHGIERKAELVHVGLPFPIGKLNSTEDLYIKSLSAEVVIACEFQVTSRWEDQSIKWLVCHFCVDQEANTTQDLVLLQDSDYSNLVEMLLCERVDDVVCLKTSKVTLTCSENRSNKNAMIRINDYRCQLKLLNKSGEIAPLKIMRVTTENMAGQEIGKPSQYVQLVLDAEVEQPDKRANLCLSLKLQVHVGSSTITTKIKIHNPNGAEHAGGLWDLGDPGSIYFKALIFEFLDEPEKSNNRKLQVNQCEDEIDVDNQSLAIVQNSSGGECWDSVNHIDVNGDVTTSYKGYKVFDRDKNAEVQSGDRANPLVTSINKNSVVELKLEYFWQSFPSAISFTQDAIAIEIFPEDKLLYELQPGESKTHTIFIDVDGGSHRLFQKDHSLVPKIAREIYAVASVFPYFDDNHNDDEFDQLLSDSLNSENSFLLKREMIDEYGWRNFGDLYADHETQGYTGEGKFISHYNNQYDALYGMIRQWALKTDSRWLELIVPFVQHICDIDIYNTRYDRKEYAGGLFWHTDHYLKAYTCTHRTYSKFHVKDGQEVFGGGPCGEHCYTSGLKYYYFMTGDSDAKQAVETLNKWITGFYEGAGSLVERALQFKEIDLFHIRNLRGGRTLAYRYPLDRGVGNYILSFLDLYEITSDAKFLDQAERIIRNTVHYQDDLRLRELDDIEENWFFTIFFQAVIRYLEVVEKLEVARRDFQFIRKTLLHYATWILDHDSPYLTVPEKLEYPNHAWAVQDIRKAHILFAAYRFADGRNAEYLNKAQYFRDYVVDTLKNSDELKYTRTQCVLMQNHGCSAFFNVARPAKIHLQEQNDYPYREASLARIMLNFLGDIIKRLFRLSVKRELEWLSYRSSKFERFQGIE